jgi:hypothetical protein
MNTVVVHAAWDPLGYSGKDGVKAGEKLLGNYISGMSILCSIHS